MLLYFCLFLSNVLWYPPTRKCKTFESTGCDLIILRAPNETGWLWQQRKYYEFLLHFVRQKIVPTSEMHRLKSTDCLPTPVECPCACARVFLQDVHIALIVWKMPSHVSKELGTTYVYIHYILYTNILHKISGFVVFPRKSNSCCDASIMGSQASRYEVQSVYTGVKHLKGGKTRGGWTGAAFSFMTFLS